MLMPAAVLVVMVLGALAVDFTVARLARRDLAAAADAAANDAVTAGLDEALFRETGQFVLDPARVDAVVRASLALHTDDVVGRATVSVDTDAAAGIVTVTLHSTADAVFGRAIPGFRTLDVSASSTAQVDIGTPGP